MKKKTNTVFVLLGILAVLLILFFGLKWWNDRSAKEEEKKKQDETVHIFQADGLEKMSYEDSEGKSMAFEKQDDAWMYSEDVTIGLQEDILSDMEEAFADIQAVREISEPDDLSDYGFDAPQYRLNLTGEDGKERKFLVGEQSGENYYFMEDGQKTVYTIESDLISEMVWDMANLAKKDSFVNVTENNFVKEVVTKADGTETVYDADDEEQEEEVAGVTGGLSEFYFTDCADYHVTDEILADYGLDEGSRTKVVLTYQDLDDDNKEKEITFYVGNIDDSDTYYYVQLEGSQMVNRVTVSSVEAALGWKTESQE